MGWWMVLMGVFWLLFMASAIYLFLSAFTRGRGHDDGDALEIAKRRLARGEITTDQFQEIRRHVEGVVRVEPSSMKP
jgi:uncharacterized membrane protein